MLADLAEAVHLATRAKTPASRRPARRCRRKSAGALRSVADGLSVPLLSRDVADADEGTGGGGQGAGPGGGRRDGADPHRLYRRPAVAREIMRALGGEAVARTGSPAAGREREQRAATPQARGLRRRLMRRVRAEAEFDDFDETRRRTSRASDGGMGQQPRSFAEVVALAGRHRDAKLKVHLEEHVSLVRFDAAGSIDVAPAAGAPGSSPTSCARSSTSGPVRRWMVALSPRPASRRWATSSGSAQADESRGREEPSGRQGRAGAIPRRQGHGVRHTRPDRDDDKAAG